MPYGKLVSLPWVKQESNLAVAPELVSYGVLWRGE